MGIRVYLISSFRILRESLERVICARSETFSLVGSADNPVQAAAAIQDNPVEVILWDIDGEPDSLLSNLSTLKSFSPAHILLLHARTTKCCRMKPSSPVLVELSIARPPPTCWLWRWKKSAKDRYGWTGQPRPEFSLNFPGSRRTQTARAISAINSVHCQSANGK